MLGVLDSGAGGLVSYAELRRLQPMANLCYLADRKNAPYGTKSEDEILTLTEGGIRRLLAMGCERILIACCTASSVYQRLPEELRQISLPIISLGARECRDSRSVLVIATEHTARCGAFSREIARFSDASVTEIAFQPLVNAIEWGEDTSEMIYRVERLCLSLGADTLMLGCTHFSHLLGELSAALRNIKIISPAHLGARELTRIKISRERGLDIYTS